MIGENLQHSPSTSGEVEQRELFGVLGPRERFCEDVGAVVLGGAVRDTDRIGEYVLANEVMAYVDMFGACMELVVVCE